MEANQALSNTPVLSFLREELVNGYRAAVATISGIVNLMTGSLGWNDLRPG